LLASDHVRSVIRGSAQSLSCVARVFIFFSFFCWFLDTYSIKFYTIGFVSSCCVQWACDCRVLKSVI